MNKAHRIILISYTVLVAACCAYVPWDWCLPTPGDSYRIPLGYDWLWTRPITEKEGNLKVSYFFGEIDRRQVDLNEVRNYTRISVERLAVELIGITIIGASLFFLYWRRQTS